MVKAHASLTFENSSTWDLPNQVLDPRAAVRDEEKFNSDTVKKSLETLKTYRANLGEISATLVSQTLFP